MDCLASVNFQKHKHILEQGKTNHIFLIILRWNKVNLKQLRFSEENNVCLIEKWIVLDKPKKAI